MKKEKFDDFDDKDDDAFGSKIKEKFEEFFNNLEYDKSQDDNFNTICKNNSVKTNIIKYNNEDCNVNENSFEISNLDSTSINSISNKDFDSNDLPDLKVSKKFSMVYSKKDKPKEINKEIKLELDTEEYLRENNLSINKIRSIIEGTLYVMGSNGLNLVEIQKIVNLPIKILKNILEQMMHEKDVDINSGICIKLYDNTYKLLSKDSIYYDICKILNKNETKPLSRSKLEILSIIAYNQPCTKKVIESIRGKDPSHALYSLLELGIIEKHNRSNEPGNPNLYVVTELFFDLFGIKSLSELPKIKPESENLIQNIISNVDE